MESAPPGGAKAYLRVPLDPVPSEDASCEWAVVGGPVGVELRGSERGMAVLQDGDLDRPRLGGVGVGAGTRHLAFGDRRSLDAEAISVVGVRMFVKMQWTRCRREVIVARCRAWILIVIVSVCLLCNCSSMSAELALQIHNQKSQLWTARIDMMLPFGLDTGKFRRMDWTS